MLPIHGYYLYELGTHLHPLAEIEWRNAKWGNVFYKLTQAKASLNGLLHESVFKVRASNQEGLELLSSIDAFLNLINIDTQWDDIVPTNILFPIVDKATRFETVFKAELGITPMFYVQPKHNIDIAGYITDGDLSFPESLSRKVPEAIIDAKQAAKCIAFDLPTAAGFHLHRANECVLRKYFDCVAGPDNRPRTANMGDYINKLSELKKGDSFVRAALRDLKDLHRNPLMHPDSHISSIDDALSLLGGVRAVMSQMLKAIPEPPSTNIDKIAEIYNSNNLSLDTQSDSVPTVLE